MGYSGGRTHELFVAPFVCRRARFERVQFAVQIDLIYDHRPNAAVLSAPDTRRSLVVLSTELQTLLFVLV